MIRLNVRSHKSLIYKYCGESDWIYKYPLAKYLVSWAKLSEMAICFSRFIVYSQNTAKGPFYQKKITCRSTVSM